MMNAIIIGLETDFPEKFAWDIVENIFLVFFTIELVTRTKTAVTTSHEALNPNPKP